MVKSASTRGMSRWCGRNKGGSRNPDDGALAPCPDPDIPPSGIVWGRKSEVGRMPKTVDHAVHFGKPSVFMQNRCDTWEVEESRRGGVEEMPPERDVHM